MSPPPRHLDGRARLDAEDGLSLVEVVVSLFIMGIVLSALASTVIASTISVSRSDGRQAAYTAATRAIESLRAINEFDDVALPPLGADPLNVATAFDPIGGTIAAPGTTLPVVRATYGELAGEPYQYDGEGFRLRTYVTDYTDPDPAFGSAEQRLVTVLVEFTRRDSVEIVRESTLISDARWGVAQPSFSVTPVGADIVVERGTPGCIEHVVTNRGSTDRYRVELPPMSAFPTGQYEPLKVYEDRNGDGIPDPSERLHGGDLTQNAYAYGEELTLLACHEARLTATQDAKGVPLTIISDLNPDLDQTVLHTIRIDEDRTFSLSSRGEEARDPAIDYELTGDPSTGASLPSYDTNLDTRPGLRLPAEPSSSATYAARWRRTWDDPRTIVSASVRLWTSAPSTVGSPPTKPLVQRYRVELHRLAPDGTSTAVLHSSTRSVTQPDGGWNQRDWDLPIATPVKIAEGEHLQLRVACELEGTDPETQTDCSLAFHTEQYPAVLHVEFP